MSPTNAHAAHKSTHTIHSDRQAESDTRAAKSRPTTLLKARKLGQTGFGEPEEEFTVDTTTEAAQEATASIATDTVGEAVLTQAHTATEQATTVADTQNASAPVTPTLGPAFLLPAALLASAVSLVVRSTPLDTSLSPAGNSLTLQGLISAGPVVSGHGLEVDIINSAGQVISTVAVDENGMFMANVNVAPGEVLLARVKDTDSGAPDYLDEATGHSIDLEADLLVAFVVGTSGSMRIAVNPLTTVATLDMGVSIVSGQVQVPDTLTPTQVRTINNVLARAIGLGETADIALTQAIPTNSDAFTPETLEPGEKVGLLLAAISGAAKTNSQTEAINQLVGGVRSDGTWTADAFTFLVIGAQVAQEQAGSLQLLAQIESVVHVASETIQSLLTVAIATATETNTAAATANTSVADADTATEAAVTNPSADNISDAEAKQTAAINAAAQATAAANAAQAALATYAAAANAGNEPMADTSAVSAAITAANVAATAAFNAATLSEIAINDKVAAMVAAVTGVGETLQRAKADFDLAAQAMLQSISSQEHPTTTEQSDAITLSKHTLNAAALTLQTTAEATQSAITAAVNAAVAASKETEDFSDLLHAIGAALAAIDTTGPTLGSTAPSTTVDTRGFTAGESITLTITFDGPVYGLHMGSNSTVFTVGGIGVSGTWSGSNGSATRTLTYTLQPGQVGQAAIDETALNEALTTGISDAMGNMFANNGNIANIDTTALPAIDTSLPTLGTAAPFAAVGDAVAGTPGNSENETIVLTINFDRAVQGLINGNNNTIFTVDGHGVDGIWTGSDNTNSRTLTYTVQPGHNGQVAINAVALKAALIAGITGENGSVFGYNEDFPEIDSTALPVIDTQAPNLDITQVNGNVATDGIINADERTAGVVLSGTTEPGRSVTINTGTGSSLTVESDATTGAWTATVDSSRLPSSGNGNVTFTVNSSDAAGNIATITRTVSIDTAAPTITVGYSIDENTSANTATQSINLGASENVTWSNLNGTDATAFTLSSSGVLTFTDLADFETKSSYNFNVTATDTAGNATTQAITIQILDINEAPIAIGTIPAQTVSILGSGWTLNSASFFNDIDASDLGTYSITSGSLPIGLALDSQSGTILGIVPTGVLPGTYNDLAVTRTDAGGLTATQTFDMTLTAPPSTISLGNEPSTGTTWGGQLMAPVQVEGRWYYFWDRNNNGNHTGDNITFSALETMLQSAGVEGPITELNRSFTVNGVQLKLPTDGLQGTTGPSSQIFPAGTSNQGEGITENLTFDDMFAIWDAFNGASNGANIGGTPPDWQASHYWTATPGSDGGMTRVGLNSGTALVEMFTATQGLPVAFELVGYNVL